MSQKEFGGREYRTDRWEYLLLGLCLLFYLLFPVVDGPVWCVDSGGYVSMHISREPLYPSFLALCRWVAGVCRAEPLMIAVVLQSLLAGMAAWSVGWAVRRAKQGGRVLQIAAILFQFAVTLLNRFAAKRGSAYSDSILTEGLGLSLFVLFSVFLFLFITREKKRYLWFTLLFSFLLVSLRKQMMITLLIMGVVFAWYELIRRKNVRRFLCLAVMVAAVFFASKLFDRTYQYAVRGVWMEHSGNSMGILCTLLYSSDPERDAALFEDETIKQLYLEIMERADEQQILYPYAGDGWLTTAIHYADSYDAIGYGIINPVVEGYISEHYSCSEPEAAMKYDAVCKAMSNTLFRQEPLPLLRVYCYNTWQGLVNSVAKANHILSVYAVAAYLAMGTAAGILIAWKKKLRKQAENLSGQLAGRYEELVRQIDTSLCFAFITMAGILINAVVVGLIIFAQPRYMIYGMGLFYTACSMIARDLYTCYREERISGGRHGRFYQP